MKWLECATRARTSWGISGAVVLRILFAAIATMLTMFFKSRAWFVGMWMRLTENVTRFRRRPEV